MRIFKLLSFIGLLTIFIDGSCLKADDVWFIDTRPARIAPDGRMSGLSVEKFDPNSAMQWSVSDLDEFLQTQDSEKPTVIMIHGNLMTRAEARSHGLAFHRLTRKLGRNRLVIWCWPAEKRHCRIRPDVQIKALRAEAQGMYLAAFLRELQGAKPAGKVSILGFSYGARVTCNALDLLGRDSDENGANSLRIRPVLLAAAMDRHSLSPGQRYGEALSVTEKMLVHVNRNDKTLRYYPLLFRLHGPQAVGKEGVGGLSPTARQKVETVRVDRLLGEDHGFMKSLLGFLACENDFRRYALFE